MNKENIKTEIIVKDRKIGVLRIGNKEYMQIMKNLDFQLEIG